MTGSHIIKGFSKLSDDEKRRIVAAGLENPQEAEATLFSFLHADTGVQNILSGFSENTLTNFALPFGVAPNFLINGKVYMVPMVIEESSVVAAAASAASFWASREGFKAEVVSMEKTGQLHFLYHGDMALLRQAENDLFKYLLDRVRPLTARMESRGGGILSLSISDMTHVVPNYHQLHVAFNTADAMGANFINSILEEFAEGVQEFLEQRPGFSSQDAEPLMAILSNYTPNCLVEVSVGCHIKNLGTVNGMPSQEFVRRFIQAVDIARADVYRAVTHNKGIMNGVDAVVVATGNDFRAVEAGVHAYASRTGAYRSLSHATQKNGHFQMTLEIPLALGTLGGLTRLHPLASLALKMLGSPSAKELMMIAAAAGLANNFSAVRSLVTTGIQSGHMRMHLPNILQQFKASSKETEQAMAWFSNKKVSHKAVGDFLFTLREGGTPS